jgi:hypothetical protein
MKKLLFVLTASMLFVSLSGCAGTTSSSAAASSSAASSAAASSAAASSSAAESSSAASSSSSVASSVNYAAILNTFLAPLANDNYTLTINDYVTYQQLGTKAVYKTYLGDYASNGNAGYVLNGSQGLFRFSLAADGSFVIGNCLSPAGATKLTAYCFDITAIAPTEASWKHTEGEDYIFTTSDVTIGTTLANVGGYGSYTSKATAFATTLTIDEAKTSATFATTMTYNKKDYTIAGAISLIGSTSIAAVDAYIAAPATLVAPKAWKSDTQTGMTSLINEVLPFPSGVSYATSESMTTDDSGAVSDITFQDFASGDISEAYKAALVADGWTLSESRTDVEAEIAQYGYAMYMYEKVKTPATSTMGPLCYTVQVDFIAKDILDLSSKALYPNGVFQVICTVYQNPLITNVSVAELNTYYATIKKTDGTAALPTLTLGSEVTKIVLTDYTAMASANFGLAFTNYSDAKLSIADKATAVSDVTTIEASLSAAGLTSSGDDFATTGSVTYSLVDDAFPDGFSISFTLGAHADGSYNGVLSIDVMAF